MDVDVEGEGAGYAKEAGVEVEEKRDGGVVL